MEGTLLKAKVVKSVVIRRKNFVVLALGEDGREQPTTKISLNQLKSSANYLWLACLLYQYTVLRHKMWISGCCSSLQVTFDQAMAFIEPSCMFHAIEREARASADPRTSPYPIDPHSRAPGVGVAGTKASSPHGHLNAN